MTHSGKVVASVTLVALLSFSRAISALGVRIATTLLARFSIASFFPASTGRPVSLLRNFIHRCRMMLRLLVEHWSVLGRGFISTAQDDGIFELRELLTGQKFFLGLLV